MADNYCAGYAIEYHEDEITHEIEHILKVMGCKHPAWRMFVVGIPGVFGDFCWECTKCGRRLQGRNPFKDIENLEDI